MSEKITVCGQMLSLLVMDLGYIKPPVYGRDPLRHQIAWNMCEDFFGSALMIDKTIEMIEQAESEKRG